MKISHKISLFFMVGALLTGCSDKDEKEKEPVFEKTDMRIFAWNELTGGVIGGDIINEQTYLITILAYKNNNNCHLKNETYAWIENYSEAKLKFVVKYNNQNEYLYFPNDKIYIYQNNPSIPEYDWDCTLEFVGEIASTYEFALKFYQPETGKYFITPRHRIKVSPSNNSWIIGETSVIE